VKSRALRARSVREPVQHRHFDSFNYLCWTHKLVCASFYQAIFQTWLGLVTKTGKPPARDCAIRGSV